MKVLPGQHQDEAEDLPELCSVHLSIWLWILEDAREWHYQAVSTSHTNVLAWHHLQPTATRLLQSRQHGDHRYEKGMEMDWTCHEKRPGQQHTRSPSLDTRGGSAQEGVQKHLVPNCWGGAQDLEVHLVFNSQASPKPSDVDILRSCHTCHKA